MSDWLEGFFLCDDGDVVSMCDVWNVLWFIVIYCELWIVNCEWMNEWMNCLFVFVRFGFFYFIRWCGGCFCDCLFVLLFDCVYFVCVWCGILFGMDLMCVLWLCGCCGLVVVMLVVCVGECCCCWVKCWCGCGEKVWWCFVSCDLMIGGVVCDRFDLWRFMC